MTIKTWAERLEHIPDGEITTSAHIQSAMLEEIEELRTQLAAIDAAEPVVYQAKSSPGFISCSPYTWEDCTPEQFTEYQGVIETRKLFTRPMPAQPIIGLQDVHDAVTADPTLAQPNIQNQIIKDISEKPCHACAHYQQGKRPGVSIHDETCYGCSEYYTNKWEAA